MTPARRARNRAQFKRDVFFALVFSAGIMGGTTLAALAAALIR